MAGNVQRGTEEMHQFVKDWEAYEDEISKIVRNLDSCCATARGVLQDEVSGRLIRQIEEFGPQVLRTVQQGDERVRELERSARTLDELDGIR